MAVAGAALLLSQLEIEEPSNDLAIPLSLTRNQWLNFVRVCIDNTPTLTMPAMRLGSFDLTIRRLCDLGVMDNPRMVSQPNAEDRLWIADWVIDKKAFYNPMAQYRFFSESIERYASEAPLLAYVGAQIDQDPITLSGALMVAHRAGLPGFLSWVINPKERTKFTRNTTQHFKRANGIF